MDKRSILTKFLMAIGFIGAGIGGAVAAGEIPENLEKMKELLKEPKEASEEKAE